MKWVKMFYDRSQSGIEEQINNWLDEKIYEIVDIKFAVDGWGYHVLVLYKYKPI